MFRLPAILLGVLTALPAAAELVPLGDWPVDETRTALQMGDELFRNCGRVLERWDVAADPPVLLDSLVLDSPPIDLLDWDGILLVQRDDGLLEARDPASDWSQPDWTLTLFECVFELRRVGDWLMPVGPFMGGIDLTNPRQPLISSWQVGGKHRGCWVAGHWVRTVTDCCGSCWDIAVWDLCTPFDEQGPISDDEYMPGYVLPNFTPYDLAACGSRLAVAQSDQLTLYDVETWEPVVVSTLPGEFHKDVRIASRGLDVAIALESRLLVYRFNPHANLLTLLDDREVPGGVDLDWDVDGLLVTSMNRTTRFHLEEEGNLVEEWNLPSGGSVRSIARNGDHLLVRQNDLHVLRQENAYLEPVATLPLPEGCCLAVSGSIALADADSSLVVINLAQPNDPTILCSIPAPGLERLCQDGQRAAYVADGELVILSLEDPCLPLERLRLPVGTVTGLVIGGGIVACSEQQGAIRLMDARDLEHVQEAASLPFISWSQRIAFCEERLVLSWQTYIGSYPHTHVAVYSLSDPFTPQIESERVLEYFEFRGLWAGSDRVLIGAHFTPIWGYGTEFFLFDLVEGSPLAQTAHWEIMPGDPIPAYTLLDGGWLVRHFEDSGIDLLLDDTILPTESLPERPATLSLAAAPNPFNPVTRLSFTLERPGAVRLVVFDLLGRQVALPLDGELAAGVHEITFDASELASGVYFARLEAEGRTTVAKLALVR